MYTNKFRSRGVLLLGLLVAGFALNKPLHLLSFADRAQSVSSTCGATYRVAPGDTLSGIAAKVYGHADYQVIFAANRNVLTSPARITVGDELVIPCPDDTLQKVARTKTDHADALTASLDWPGADPREPMHSAAAIVPDPASDNRRVRFLTGSDFAPFAHADLPGNGMAAELMSLAMARAAPGRPTTLTLVEDWSAHLDLLEDGTFDVGFPWYRPDCTKAAMLSPSMQRRCAGFDFSKPLFEVAIGYYARAGDPLATSTGYGQLSGRRICRPATHFTFDLQEQGLGRPGTALVFPPEADDCFALLRSGAVDVATLSKPLAEKSLLRLGLVGQVVEIPALASRQTMHAIASKANPRGRAYLALIDAGTDELHQTGRWFEVASRYFGDLGIRPQ